MSIIYNGNISDYLTQLTQLNEKRTEIEKVQQSISIFKGKDYTKACLYYIENKELPEDKFKDFKKILNDNNFTIDEISAFYQYTDGSEMIQTFNKGSNKKNILKGIEKELFEKLTNLGLDGEKKAFIYEDILEIIEENKEKTLAEKYEISKTYFDKRILPSVNKFIKDYDKLENIEDIIKNLNSCLNHKIGKEVEVYRAMDEETFRKLFNLNSKEKLEKSNLEGQILKGKDYCSTSIKYESSFAKYDCYDVVFKIKLDKDIKGFYGPEVSVYGPTEDELLLPKLDIKIDKINESFVDDNGKHKILIESTGIQKELENVKNIEEIPILNC